MKAHHILAGSALILTSAWAVAQDAPESLLPPGFDRPAPRRDGGRDAPRDVARTPVTTASGTPSVISGPVVQPIGQVARGPVRSAPVVLPPGVPSLEALEGMSPEQLDDVLGLKPKDDIPPAARRALRQVGMIDESEGGLPHWSLRQQDAGLVGAAIQGNSGRLVSRWGHILLRRALASRLDAPAGLDPADFAAMRSALLVRMGEGAAARYIAQDVDTANYSPALTRAAFDAYVATSDFTGLCPAIALKGVDAKDIPGNVEALKQVGLIQKIDLEAGNVVFDGQKWEDLSEMEGGRSMALYVAGRYCESKGTKEIIGFNSLTGQSVGSFRDGTKVTVFR